MYWFFIYEDSGSQTHIFQRNLFSVSLSVQTDWKAREGCPLWEAAPPRASSRIRRAGKGPYFHLNFLTSSRMAALLVFVCTLSACRTGTGHQLRNNHQHLPFCWHPNTPSQDPAPRKLSTTKNLSSSPLPELLSAVLGPQHLKSGALLSAFYRAFYLTPVIRRGSTERL